MSPIYQLEGVTRTYGRDATRVVALEPLDVTIGRGEFLVVVGPSGSGKTTLLQLLGALERPSGGSIRLEGSPLEQLADSALADLRLRALGFVFQQFNLIPTLTATENVEASLAPLAMAGSARHEVVRDHLEAVGLAPRARHLPAQLSGGEQQRVAIARALARSPRVVLADEPTGNLDTRAGEMVMNLLVRLHEDLQVTLVVVTHAEWIAERADRVLRLVDGRLVEDSAVPGSRTKAVEASPNPQVHRCRRRHAPPGARWLRRRWRRCGDEYRRTGARPAGGGPAGRGRCAPGEVRAVHGGPGLRDRIVR